MLTALLIGGALAVGLEVRFPSLPLPAALVTQEPDPEIVAPVQSPAPRSEVVQGWPDSEADQLAPSRGSSPHKGSDKGSCAIRATLPVNTTV